MTDVTTPEGRKAIRATIAGRTAGAWSALRGTLWASSCPHPLIQKAPGYDTHYGPIPHDAHAIVAAVNAIVPALDRIDELERELSDPQRLAEAASKAHCEAISRLTDQVAELRGQLANRGTDGAPRVDQRDALQAQLRACQEERDSAARELVTALRARDAALAKYEALGPALSEARQHGLARCDERDEARREVERLRDCARRASQVLIACVGADGPANVDVIAERAAAEIDRLRAPIPQSAPIGRGLDGSSAADLISASLAANRRPVIEFCGASARVVSLGRGDVNRHMANCEDGHLVDVRLIYAVDGIAIPGVPIPKEVREARHPPRCRAATSWGGSTRTDPTRA